MTTTVFTDYVTPVPAAWLNDINIAVYTALGSGGVAPATAADIITNLNISTNTTLAATYLTITNAAATYLSIANAATTYAALAGATFTGTITAPTINASSALEVGGVNINTLYATLASPPFTGTPTAPTATTGSTGTQLATLDFVIGASSLPVEGRLTLITGTAIVTPDVTGATTLYFTPYKGDRIAVYNGTKWELHQFNELSIAVPASVSQMYDVFIYNNAGTLTLELTAWTSDTTRATGLVLLNGVYVRAAAPTRRYLGSFRTTTVSGQTEDSKTKRYVWNAYNRVERVMQRFEPTANWNYTTAAWRQANGSTSNQLDFIIGLDEDPVYATVTGGAGNSGLVTAAISFGLDSTTAVVADAIEKAQYIAGTVLATMTAQYAGFPGIGRHYLTWLEFSQAAGTTTWYGTGTYNTVPYRNGLIGKVLG